MVLVEDFVEFIHAGISSRLEDRLGTVQYHIMHTGYCSLLVHFLIP